MTKHAQKRPTGRPKELENPQNIVLKMEAAVWEKLKLLAARRGCSAAELVRLAVHEKYEKA